MAFNKTGTPMSMAVIERCAKCGSTEGLLIKEGNLICERCLNENKLQTTDNQ